MMRTSRILEAVALFGRQSIGFFFEFKRINSQCVWSLVDRLLVGHFIDLLFHHVSAAVNQGVLDSWDFFCCLFDIGG